MPIASSQVNATIFAAFIAGLLSFMLRSSVR